jgi:hypothetical protein
MAQLIGGDATSNTPPNHGRMETDLQDHIGRQLRAVYNEVLDEPIPDRFRQLLAGLAGREGSGS